jgi:hypothetical protein
MKKPTTKHPISLILVALSVALSFTMSLSTARGELLFSESFDYPAGPLGGQGPPPGSPPGQTGWTTVSGNPQVVSTGLTYPHILSAGGATVIYGGNSDHAVANLSPVTSGVVWIGFLIELSSGSDDGYATLNPSGLVSPNPGFGVLFDSGVFGIDNDTGGRHSFAYTSIAPSATPQWLVVRLDFTAGSEMIYVNPTSGNTAPHARLRMSPEFQGAGFDQINLNAGFNLGVWIYDEVRVGTTLADIVSGT